MRSLAPQEARKRLQAEPEAVLLDVREPWEFDRARLPGARLLPLGALPGRLDELPRDRPLIVYCHHGLRSALAVRFLEQNGFDPVFNLTGGIDAWSLEVDPAVPRY